MVLERMAEAADAGHEMYWQRAIKSVTCAVCTAIAHRPHNERDLVATLYGVLRAMRRERRAV